MRKIEVVPHQEVWKFMYAEEAKKIQVIMGDDIVKIYHIGSTSIPNIYAKPIIDILVEVREIGKVDDYNAEMEKLGYEAMGENGIHGRRFFKKGGGERTHHVHVFQLGSEHVNRHLAFKEYLLAHPDVAQQYSELKRKLAKQFPDHIESYMDGKDPFIKEVEAQAIAWYEAFKLNKLT